MCLCLSNREFARLIGALVDETLLKIAVLKFDMLRVTIYVGPFEKSDAYRVGSIRIATVSFSTTRPPFQSAVELLQRRMSRDSSRIRVLPA